VDESELDLKLRLQSRKCLEDAVRSALKIAVIAPLPFILFVVAGSMMRKMSGEQTSFDARVAFAVDALIWTISFGSFYACLASLACGWLAHRVAFGTFVPVQRLSIALAWVANLSLWGWIAIVAITDSRQLWPNGA
jgi:hypothetical protein